MQVLKFGGTSVANAQNMSQVTDIVIKAVDRDRTILVASAIRDVPTHLSESETSPQSVTRHIRNSSTDFRRSTTR